jgi:hypothetical protein
LVATVAVLASFAATTLVDEPATLVMMIAILTLSVVLDAVWKSRKAHASA